MAVNTHSVYSNASTANWRRYVVTGAPAQYSSIKGLTQFTWEAWIKLKPEWGSGNNNLNKAAIWYEGKPNKANVPSYTLPRFVVSATTTHVRFSLAVSDTDGLSHYTYPIDLSDQWTHIAFAVDTGAEEYDIIVNGALVQTGKLIGGGIDVNDDPLPITDSNPSLVSALRGFYNNVPSSQALWSGGIEYARLWQTRKSAGSILTDMNDHVTVSAPNLLYQYNFDDTNTDGRLDAVRSANITGVAYLGMVQASGVSTTPNITTDRPFLGNGVADSSAPTVPTMKAHANVSSTGFTISWNASTDNVAVQNYELTVATDSLFNNPVQGWAGRNVGRALIMDFEDGMPNGSFYARVRAVDTSGNASAWSTYSNNAPIITKSTADYTAPSVPPQNLRVTSVSSSSFSLEWERGADIDEVAGYKVHVGLTPSFATMVPAYRNVDIGLSTQFTFDTDILPLTAYWVKVRSYDQNANESWDSDTIQVVTQSLPDIEPPAEVSLESPTAVEATRFTLRWLPTTDNVGVEGYIVDIARDVNFEQPVNQYSSLDVGNVLRTNIYGLEELKTYFARVRAYDQAGNISVFEADPLAITTAPLTSSEDGVIEVGTQAETFTHDGVEYPNETDTPSIIPVTSEQAATVKFSAVTAVGEPTNLEMFVWVDELLNEGITLEVFHESTLLGSVQPTRGEAWISVQIPNPPADLLTGTSLRLEVVPKEGETSGSLTIGTGMTNENPAPTISFHLDTEQVIRPVESELDVDFTTVRNFIANPDFLHDTKSTFGFSASNGVSDDFYHDVNWDVRVRRSTMVNGGTFHFHSEQITDSTNKMVLSNPLRGAIYLGIISNNGTKASANFQVALGVEYTDATENIATSVVEVVDGLHPYFVNGLNINQAKEVSRVFIRVSSEGAYVGSIASYLPTVYQSPEQLYPFSGNTYSAKWEEELNFGTSSLSYPRISGTLSYIGDSDDTGSARLSLLSRDVGLTTNSWFGTGIAVKDSETKTFTASAKTQFVINQLGNGSFDIIENTNWYPSLLGLGHEIDLEFGGMNIDGDYSRSGYRHLNVILKNKDTNSSDLLFGVANSQVLPKHAINGGHFRATVRGKAGAVFTVSFLESSGTRSTVLQTKTLVSDEWEDVSFNIPLGAVEYSGYIRMYMSTADYSTGEKFSIDGVQVGSNIPFFADETFGGSFTAGEYGRSPVMAFLPYNGNQDVVWLVDDPDGVDSEMRLGMTGILTDTIKIEGAPDNILTVKDLRAEVTEHTMRVIFEYEGDDGQTADIDIKWKRTDFTEEQAWNRVPVSWNRSARTATALITELNPRTSYTVVATATDKLLPTYGENPIQRTFTTLAPRQKALSTPKILFGGFVLQDENTKGVWVERHNAFDHPVRNLKVDKLPRYQGSVEISDWWEKREIQMSGGISATSRQELAELKTALQLALSKGQQNLVIDTLDERNYYFTATCTKLEIPEEAGVNFRHLKWTATFTCADPFRYDSREDVEEGITLVNGETFRITNFGDLGISPQFHVTTSSPTNVEFTLINSSTGQRITPVTKIKAGDTLQILSDQLKVVKNGVPIDFSGSFPHLDVGENILEVQTFPIAYSVDLTVRRRHKYF